MEFFKKLDLKTIIILVLGVALIISFFFGQKNNIDTHTDEISILHKKNAELIIKNDSINAVNVKIDAVISVINKELIDNNKALATSQKELQNLKKKQNEIPTYVKHLSANGVANAFSDFLNTKSSNTN